MTLSVDPTVAPATAPGRAYEAPRLVRLDTRMTANAFNAEIDGVVSDS